MSTPPIDLRALFDKAYRSAAVESNRTSTNFKKPALADDGLSGEARAGWRHRPLWHERTQPSRYRLSELSLPKRSTAGFYLPNELTEVEKLNSEPEMLLLPETRPISHEQLVIEVKGIYAGVVLVEAKCIDIDERQSATTQEDQSKKWHLKNDQWQSWNALHRQLLAASQHPLASPALTRLVRNESDKGAPKLEMPGPPDESSEKLSWMDRVQRYAMARATEEANDIKRETERAVVRDALGGSFQEPSHLTDISEYPSMIIQEKIVGAQYDSGAEGSFTSRLIEALKLHSQTKEREAKCIALNWMDHVLRYATAKATEEASDSKSEPNSVAVVRNTLGGDSQAPSRLKPSPRRKFLPMMLQGKAIGAQHDTGAEGSNFMTNKLAEDLNLHIRTKESDRKSFSMGTGKVRRALGRVKACCAFAKESGTKMKCWFYVLPKLASPLIMGSQFLRDTKTMSHFTHRLEDQPSCTPIAPMVNLISSTQQAKRRLVAFIDDRQTYINADSGSHLDLMSSAYIKKYGYKLDRRRECRKRIRLADDTTAETIGQVKAELTLHDGSTYLKTFDVLPGLMSEVLIGEDTLAELKIFTEHESSFMDVFAGDRHFELSILCYLGRLNEFLVRELNLGNRRSQYQYQCELSLGLSPVFRY